MRLEGIHDFVRSLFLIQYYSSNVWNGNTKFFGFPVCNNPCDCWVLQEIIFETRPTVIIETGTWYGGSALYLAILGDILCGHCGVDPKVITIDINETEHKPIHKRIKYLVGSSVSKRILDEVGKLIKKEDKVMVILDSNHNDFYVEKELKGYSKLVTKGMYLIVNDTHLNGNPIALHPADLKEAKLSGRGPNEAIIEFLKTNKEFEVDKSREKFLLTFCPGGYLRRL